MSVGDVKEVSSTAVELLGNANARISRLRRDKLVSINKSLTPLVQDDTEFASASPNLFGSDFSKRAKEYLDQVKTLKATLPPRQQGRGEVVPVHLPPLRPGVSTMGLYQDPEADSSSRARAGDADRCLHRRHSPHG